MDRRSPSRNRKSVYQRYEEALIRMALWEEAHKCHDIPPHEAANIEQMNAFFADTEERTCDLIRQVLNKRRKQKFIRGILSGIIRFVVGIVLIGFIFTTTVVAAVPSMREHILEFLVAIDAQYTQVDLTEKKDEAFYKPSNWQGSYYPSYVPEGFTLMGISGDALKCSVGYVNSQGQVLSFTEYDSSLVVSFDAKNKKIRNVRVNNALGFSAESQDEMSVVWDGLEKYFLVDTTLDQEMALKIAKGVKKIK